MKTLNATNLAIFASATEIQFEIDRLRISAKFLRDLGKEPQAKRREDRADMLQKFFSVSNENP